MEVARAGAAAVARCHSPDLKGTTDVDQEKAPHTHYSGTYEATTVLELQPSTGSLCCVYVACSMRYFQTWCNIALTSAGAASWHLNLLLRT